MPTTKAEPKAGMVTTEFWFALALLVCSTALMAIDNLSESTWALANGINAAGYAVGRGLAKVR